MTNKKIKVMSILDGKVVYAKEKPTTKTIKKYINQYSLADDPYDVAVDIGKKFAWTQKQIEKAEGIISKNFIK